METQKIVTTTTTFVNPNMLLFAIIILASFLMLVLLVSKYRIYKKAGKKGISSFIPIWSEITLFQIVDKPWWYIFLYIVPIVNIIIIFETNILLAKKFGKGSGIGIGMSLVPMIFVPLLSFYDYVETKENVEEEPIFNPFNQTEVNQVMPATPSTNEPVVIEAPVNNNVLNETPIPSAPISEEPIISNQQITEISTENIVDNNVLDNNVNNENIEIPEIPVIPNIPETPIMDTNTIEPTEVKEESVIPQQMQENSVNSGVSIEDIQSALNINNKPNEISDIAFNSRPQSIVNETIETIPETLEKIEIEEPTEQVEQIEMPEIAAKVCPACGTSLASDIKFCTSCGTQV